MSESRTGNGDVSDPTLARGAAAAAEVEARITGLAAAEGVGEAHEDPAVDGPIAFHVLQRRGVDHPLRAGDRLRLPRTAVEWFAPGTPERTVAEGLNRYGMTLGDTAGSPSIAVAQDPRLAKNWQGMGLRLSDFEVVQP